MGVVSSSRPSRSDMDGDGPSSSKVPPTNGEMSVAWALFSTESISNTSLFAGET